MATKTLNENINQAINDFKGVKQAIIDKGVEIPSGTPTSEYGAKISEIQSGGSGGLDTSGVTDFRSLCNYDRFNDQLDKIDTSKGTNFSNMFYSCSSLTGIPQLDTSKGTNFSYMFNGCSSLAEIPQLDTSKGTNFSYMFNNCSSLAKVSLFKSTTDKTNYSYMFSGCKKLVEVNSSTLGKNGSTFTHMFKGCSALTALDFGHMTWSSLNHSHFNSMFYDCTKLSNLTLGSIIPVTNTFWHCSALVNLEFTGTITINGSDYLRLSDSPLLTVDSLLNVLNALADNTGKTTYKINLGSTNLAKLTSAQKAIATNKNYTLA